MKDKFDYEKDDGRTIANMDNVGNRGLLSSWLGVLSPSVREDVFGSRSPAPDHAVEKQNPGHAPNSSLEELSPEDRRALIRYTLKYALGLGSIFIIVFGIIIFILTRIW
ncbi:MAG: hypothetical protein IJS33_05500 [Firmicutes bacterium]|nr:hypothetical protein [Bacillota bacterium]